MSNNGYADRSRLVVKQRPNIRLVSTGRRPANSSLTANSSQPALNLTPSKPLPTIPVYVDMPPADSRQPRTNSSHKVPDIDFIHRGESTKEELQILPEALDDDTALNESEQIDKAIKDLPTGLSGPKAVKKPASAKKSNMFFRRRKLGFKNLFLFISLVFILGATGYVSYSTWQTNNRISKRLDDTESVVLSAEDSKATKEASKVVSANNSLLDTYKVADDLPRAIYIKSSGVAARLMPMSVNDDSSLQAPQNIIDAGWYNESAKPGDDGAILVDGHFGTELGVEAVFNRLEKTIEIGDMVEIERGDGSRLEYKVVNTENISLKDVDMNKLLVTYGGAKQGVNIITCSGDYTSDGSTRDHRFIVYAVLE